MRCGDFRTTYPADMAIFDSSVSRVLLAVFLAVLLAVPLFATSYWMDVCNRIGIAVIAAMGLNILTGFTGQISLGNAAFLAIGGTPGMPFSDVMAARERVAGEDRVAAVG